MQIVLLREMNIQLRTLPGSYSAEERIALSIIAKKAIVSGRVQGVFYRATTRAKALELNLTGYAKNLADGSVEVLAMGEPDAVDSLMRWLWTGSRPSKVSNVVILEISESEGLGADKQHHPTFATC